MDSSFNIWKLMKVDEAQRFWIWRWCINMLHASGSTVGKPNLKRKCATFFVQGDPLMEIGIREFCLIYIYIYIYQLCAYLVHIICWFSEMNFTAGWSGTNPSRYRIVRRMDATCQDKVQRLLKLGSSGMSNLCCCGHLDRCMLVDAYLINEFLPEHAFGV